MAGNAVLDSVRTSAPLIRSEAPMCEQTGQLSKPVLDALRQAGIFRMTWSRAFGGPELSPLEQIDVLEEISAADGSAGWCSMINSDGGYVTAFLEPAVAKELYPSLDMPTAVVVMPSGQAATEAGGYRLTGRWAFASGSTHTDWFFLNAVVFEDGAMQPGPEGLPKTRVLAVPASEITIHNTWVPTGLAATASNDVSIEDFFVPEERTFSIFESEAVDPSPLYAWRWMFFVNLAAVPLGIARGALTEALEIAMTKVTMPTFALARDEATVQDNIGRARALIGSARAYVNDTVARLWDALVSGEPMSQSLWTEFRLALTNSAHASKAAVTLLYEALGTTGVYRKSPLDRQMRDITTLAQHVLTQTKTYASSGRSLLGLEPGAPCY